MRNKLLFILVTICVQAVSLQADEAMLFDGFKISSSSNQYQAVLTPFATYPVLLEEYVSQTIIEGKWGNGPDEFGSDDPIGAEYLSMDAWPTSLVVNTVGDIYILDQYNNRIKKYDCNGRLVKSIDVPSFADKSKIGLKNKERVINGKVYRIRSVEPDEIYYRGKNIAIDSKDNLYYYFTKRLKTGEVWQFRDDVLVAKTTAPAIAGITVDSNDDVWVGSYNILNRATAIRKESETKRRSVRKGDNLFVMNDNDYSRVVIDVNSLRGKPKGKIVIQSTVPGNINERIFVDINRYDDFRLSGKNELFIRYSQGLGSDDKVFVNKYRTSGELISIANGRFSVMDNQGNGYYINRDTRLKVIKCIRCSKR